MKKILIGLFTVIVAFILTACSSDNLSGEYYWVRSGDDIEKVLVVDKDGGTYEDEGTHSIVDVDRKKKQFTVNMYGRDYIIYYELKEDGEIILNASSYGGGLWSDIHYYKKDSEALKRAIEKEKSN